jgi:hypothetical protein
MNFYKLQATALSFVMLAASGCASPKPAEEAPPDASEEANPVFEEDFEAGDAEEWAETEGPVKEEAADSTTESDQE